MQTTFNEKLGGMILLIAERNPVSRTALNKLLFFSEAVHLLRHNKRISLSKYHRRPYGPVPEDIDVTRNALINWKFLEETTDVGSLYIRYDYRSRETVDIEKVKKSFTDTEIEAISDVVNRLGSLAPTTLSEASHRFEPWKSAKPESPLDLTKVLTDTNLKQWLTDRGVTLPH